MSINTKHKPRHERGGLYTHECAYCGVTFQTNNRQTRYCTFAHKQAANNHRFYGRHRKQVILAVMLRQSRQSKRHSRSQSKPLDDMTPDELIAYIRQHPDQVR